MSEQRFRFICQSCQYRARIPQKYAGQYIKCPQCSHAQYAHPQDEAMVATGNTQEHRQVEAAGATAVDDKFRFVCKACNYRARIPVKYAGMAIVCPGCSKPQVADREAQESAPTGKTLEIRKVDLGPGGERFLFQCGECGYRARLPDQYRDLYIKCPGCNANQKAVAAGTDSAPTGSTVTLKKVEPGSAPTAPSERVRAAKPAPPPPPAGGLDLGAPVAHDGNDLQLEDPDEAPAAPAAAPAAKAPAAAAAAAKVRAPLYPEEEQQATPDPDADELLSDLRKSKTPPRGSRKTARPGTARAQAGAAAALAEDVDREGESAPADAGEALATDPQDRSDTEPEDDDAAPAAAPRRGRGEAAVAKAPKAAKAAKPQAAAAAPAAGAAPAKVFYAIIAALGLIAILAGWAWMGERNLRIETEITLKSTSDDLKNTSQQLKDELEGHGATRAKLDSTTTTLNTEQETHRGTQSKLQSEENAHRLTRTDLQGKIELSNQLEADLTRTKVELGKTSAALTGLRSEHDIAQRRLTEAEATITAIRNEAEDNINKGKQVARAVIIRSEATQLENQQLKARVGELELQIEELRKQLAAVPPVKGK